MHAPIKENERPTSERDWATVRNSLRLHARRVNIHRQTSRPTSKAYSTGTSSCGMYTTPCCPATKCALSLHQWRLTKISNTWGIYDISLTIFNQMSGVYMLSYQFSFQFGHTHFKSNHYAVHTHLGVCCRIKNQMKSATNSNLAKYCLPKSNLPVVHFRFKIETEYVDHSVVVQMKVSQISMPF